VSPLFATTPDLPLGQSGKFVAGAYIVVFVLVLVYVAIMAVRAQRIERDLDQLQRDVETARATADRSESGTDGGGALGNASSTGDPQHSGSLL
jgi:CcmD family protein